ncbi:hypothetical protein BKA83DRAFT_4306813 [Pisolithus microcarpus]|nr:hypothetical protein BKA83DRAFT_4306813 [Pisolithus microcarpus]
MLSQNGPREALPPSKIKSTDIVITGRYISCTEDVIAYPCYHDARRYVFVDTPGFNATYSSQKEVFEKIAKWLAATYQERKLQINGVIYTRRITDTHRCRSERTSFRICANLIGTEAAHHVRLVTTMWDDRHPRDGSNLSTEEDRKSRLKEEQWRFLIHGGAGCARFLNIPESAWDRVHGLGVERKENLLLQRELVDMKKPLKQTAARKQLHKESPASLGGLLRRLFGI